MDQDTVITIAQNALMTVIYVSAPVAGQPYRRTGGKCIQAPQIQERLCLLYRRSLAVIRHRGAGIWMLNMLTDYTVNLYDSILELIR